VLNKVACAIPRLWSDIARSAHQRSTLISVEELFTGLLSLSYWDLFADVHGFLAMLLLILFGVALGLYFALDKFAQATHWLRYTLYALVVNLVIVDIMGLYIYGAYRAEGGPRTLLKASPDTSWLHTILFEHKEMLAYAPWLLVLTALVIVSVMQDRLRAPEHRALRMLVVFCIALSLVYVLTIAGEAVLVTKAAPLR
jgi:uncharacterized membrane protein